MGLSASAAAHKQVLRYESPYSLSDIKVTVVKTKWQLMAPYLGALFSNEEQG